MFPLVADEVELIRKAALVRYRLLEGGRFFGQRRLLPEYKSNCVKLALILVRLANPAEEFSDEEEMLVSKGIAAVPVAG